MPDFELEVADILDGLQERLKKQREGFRKSIMQFKGFYEKFSSKKSDVIVVINVLGEFMRYMLAQNAANVSGKIRVMQIQNIYTFCRQYNLIIPVVKEIYETVHQ